MFFPRSSPARGRRSVSRARGRRGQVLVVVALMAPVLFGFVGLAIDTGLADLSQRWEQTAADAAALDAAQLIPAPTVQPPTAPPATPPPATVFAKAQSVAAANGYPTGGAPCITSTGVAPAVQVTYTWVDTGLCAGPSGYNYAVTVKVPPDLAQIQPQSDCWGGLNANAFSKYWCVQVTMQTKHPTQIERIFGFTNVNVRVNATAFNSSKPPSAGVAQQPQLPQPVCVGRDETSNFINNSGFDYNGWAGNGFTFAGRQWPADLAAAGPFVVSRGALNPQPPGWPGPTIYLTSPAVPDSTNTNWVWTILVGDEHSIDVYQLTFYLGNGATASVDQFAKGIWQDQTSVLPPVPNWNSAAFASKGPGQDKPTSPGGTGDLAAIPSLPAQQLPSSVTYTAPINNVNRTTGGQIGVENEWITNRYPDGSQIRVWGYNWSFGPDSGSGATNLIRGYGQGVAAITFSVPMTAWPTTPPIAMFMQDGDRCGDQGVYETPAVTAPPQPNPGPNLLEG